MNELPINWRKLQKAFQKAEGQQTIEYPRLEEIRKLLEYPDRRLKPIIFTMISSGIRIGAWDTLQWKHITSIRNTSGEIIAAKLVVYPGDQEEYYSFITPEAYNSLKEWIDFRSGYGEKITGESWVMRDIWQTTNVTYGAKWGLATSPKKLHSSAIKRLIERALWEQGVRKPLAKGKNRHEWKAAHGFRKFYKTRAEQTMRPANVELTMGHDIGVSKSYYKPTEKEILEDYLKAVDDLCIYATNNKNLENKIKVLNERNENNEYIIRSRLQEKDDALSALSDQVMKLMDEIQELKRNSGKSSEVDASSG